MKKVIVSGITGQDGSYMVEYLLNLKDIEVFGMVRRTAKINDNNFKHLLGNSRFKIVRGDLADSTSLNKLIEEIKPDYFINFAAQSFVQDSWKIPEETFLSGAFGVLKVLEAIRKYQPNCRFYNAGSSEQFGDVVFSPQNETHPFRPRSPYGAAKCAAHHLVKVYRESYGLYAVQGLLFNHESERRGEEFVTRKISQGFGRIAAAIEHGYEFTPIELGYLDAKRDWSHAFDFVDAVWRMLNQDHFNEQLNREQFIEFPEVCNETVNAEAMRKWLSPRLKEYVVSSGEEYTVRDFIKVITNHLDYDAEWVGNGLEEKLVLNANFAVKFGIKNRNLVTVNQKYYRPAEVVSLLGDSTLIRKELGWKPKISFDNLVKRMINSDLNESRKSVA